MVFVVCKVFYDMLCLQINLTERDIFKRMTEWRNLSCAIITFKVDL